MAKWNANIDGEHLRIAAHAGSTMRVLAGPGTGKSYALQRKVMRLLEENKDPSRILAVTFTNVAADALKKDLGALGVPGAELVRARTLHSLCFQILRKNKVLEITHRVARPLMQFEEDFLLEDLKAEFGGKNKTEELLRAYEGAFARQQHDQPGVVQTQEDQRFRSRLLDWLQLHQAMLIGEVVPITYDYLKNNPAAPEFEEYDYVLVDEYQDLNKAEQSLIDLVGTKAELLVVGDDAQSIYSFKHAHPEGIIEFCDTHSPLENANLQVCRRCPKKVVRLANELMGYLLEDDHPKQLKEFPGNEDGEIYATQWINADEETEGLAALIKELVSNKKYDLKPEDILILSPRRKLGYALRERLETGYGISVHTFFQEEALDTQKAQRAYAIINYLADPNDRVALRVLLGLPTCLPATYQSVCAKAKELNITPKDVLILLQQGKVSVPRSADILKRFEDLENLAKSLKDKPIAEILKILLDPAQPEDIEVLLSVVSQITGDTNVSIRDFFIRLQDRIRAPEVSDDAGFVRIMSLHKSKGLTSKAVFILGCVAGILPSIKNEDQLVKTNQTAKLQALRAEAKRLFFVALTRTKKYLILSSFRDVDFARAMQLGIKFTSTRGSKIARTQTSPFFSEVSKHLPKVISGKDLMKIFGL